ncbi:MAG: ribose-phosphate pyrophosphokinase [Nitrososphaeraceae archaeon]
MIKTKLFTGTANPILAQRIAENLSTHLEPVDIGIFSDGETKVEIKNNVRGSKAFIIQSTCAPANNTLMELILMADALHRSSVKEIVAILPYLGYTRQDRRPGYARSPISARVIADLIQSVKIDHIVTMDLHVDQIQGFFGIPVDNLSASRVFVKDILKKYVEENPIVVSPDVGSVARARSFAKKINCDLAIIDKRRPKANVSEVMNIIGDVHDRVCVLYDDMIDTGGTLCKAADALMNQGAKKVVAYCTHPILSGDALDNINSSGLTELVVTDSIPLKIQFTSGKVRQLSTAEIFAETIRRLDEGNSISELSL